MQTKILIVGDWHSNIHESPFAKAFEKIGFEVLKFRWFIYFLNYSQKGVIYKILSRIQDKYMIGFLPNKINRELISLVEANPPHILFLYRGSHIYPETIKRIKKTFPYIYMIGYNNDDPFSKKYPKWKWRHFNQSIPYYDLLLAYRFSNIDQFKANGAKQVDILRSWYLPWIHKKLDSNEAQNSPYCCDVIFVGHYEEDGRMEMLDALAANNILVKIFGPIGSTKKSGWNDAIARSIHLSHISVSYLQGYQYVLALNSAKIALCFLSKLNNDTYTRRCFEIPACGTALFSEWSADLASLFDDGVNAVLFKSQDELVERVKYYLSHPEELTLLAERGMALVQSKGHDVFSRTSWLVNKYSLLTEPGKLNPDYS